MHFLSTNVIKKIKLRGFRMPRTLIRISTEFNTQSQFTSRPFPLSRRQPAERGGGGGELLDARTSLQDDVFMSLQDREDFIECVDNDNSLMWCRLPCPVQVWSPYVPGPETRQIWN